jgi:hypothetical protein
LVWFGLVLIVVLLFLDNLKPTLPLVVLLVLLAGLVWFGLVWFGLVWFGFDRVIFVFPRSSGTYVSLQRVSKYYTIH